MSVLIKGMEMPKSCDKCELMTANYGCAFVGAVGGESYRKRAWDCPLVEVPEPMKWIPVTERLPRGADKSGKVCDNVILLLSVPFSENYVTSGWINGITEKVYYIDEFDDFFHKTDMSAVKAWMPLPQPPESEGE